jgi:hypothetical protein
MKKLLFTGCIAALGLMATFARTPNVDEVAKLKSFMAQESAVEGVKNHERLGIENLETVNWEEVAGLTWNSSGRLDSLIWMERELGGDLDIGGFAELRVVHCETNSLRTLNVAGNTAMVYLDCFENGLTQLDVSSNTNLREFCCRYNQLTAIDISRNTKLTFFCGTGNQFETIDISRNTELVEFFCANNRLTAIDLSHNRKLASAALRTNRLTTLDASNHPNLRSLTCYENELTTLDISGCPELTQLECRSNRLTTLDVSGSPNLYMLTCYDNLLTSLDLSLHTKLYIVLLQDNLLTFSTLPRLTGCNPYIYYPQGQVTLSQPADKIDLSREYEIDGATSEYVWSDAQGIAVIPASDGNGRFTFANQYEGKTLTCHVRNAAFPDLTLDCQVTLTAPASVAPPSQDAVRAYASNGRIHIETDRPSTVIIHTADGRLLLRRPVPPGTTAIALPKGIYVVTTDGRSRKLAL